MNFIRNMNWAQEIYTAIRTSDNPHWIELTHDQREGWLAQYSAVVDWFAQNPGTSGFQVDEIEAA